VFESLAATSWLWIPLTLWAAFAQTLRNAAQRHLVATLGTLGATLVRFLYGLPFAVIWLGIVTLVGREPVPSPTPAFLVWAVVGAVAQIAATALLLRVMTERNFALGVAYSKTELLQVAIFGAVLLTDPLSPGTLIAIVLGTVAVLLLSPPTADNRPAYAALLSWPHRSALLGILSGAGFAVAAVSYRGATLALSPASAFPAAAQTLVTAQALQTLLLGGWLVLRAPTVVRRVLGAWRTSLLAGFFGAAASAGWFTAGALEPVAHVRTLGLIELLFAYLVSRRLFSDTMRPIEVGAMLLLALALATVALTG
jgi:drug/metabolite transporter (DMT)-like permease